MYLPSDSRSLYPLVLHQKEIFHFTEFILGDVDDGEIKSKIYSLRISAQNGTFSSYDFTVLELLNSFSTIENSKTEIIVKTEKRNFNNYKSVILTCTLRDLNSLLPNIFYESDEKLHGFDQITVEFCDSDRISRNGKPSKYLNTEMRIENTDFGCVVQAYQVHILHVFSTPFWSYPSYIEIYQDTSIEFLEIVQLVDFDDLELFISVILSADFGVLSIPFLPNEITGALFSNSINENSQLVNASTSKIYEINKYETST